MDTGPSSRRLSSRRRRRSGKALLPGAASSPPFSISNKHKLGALQLQWERVDVSARHSCYVPRLATPSSSRQSASAIEFEATPLGMRLKRRAIWKGQRGPSPELFLVREEDEEKEEAAQPDQEPALADTFTAHSSSSSSSSSSSRARTKLHEPNSVALTRMTTKPVKECLSQTQAVAASPQTSSGCDGVAHGGLVRQQRTRAAHILNILAQYKT